MQYLGHRQRAIVSALSGSDWMAGPELSKRVGVKHEILWSYIERLRDRGFPIEGSRNGYRINGRDVVTARSDRAGCGGT